MKKIVKFKRNTMRKKARHVILCFLVLSILSGFVVPQENSYVEAASPIWDKESNTAQITEKSAAWVDYEQYLAELTIKINSTQFTRPLDVVILLDRSGSMDMNFIHEVPDGNGGTKGSHNASSPCLNQEHFYFAPTNEVPAVIPNTLEETHYDAATQRLTVYNGELGSWVVLDTSNKIHLYSQFGEDRGDLVSLALGAYHFKQDGDNFLRISKWDTTDVRKGSNAGIWDHANEADGCYDRWIEAKKAIGEFSEKLLETNQNLGLTGEDASRVSLIPFSMRDETLVQRLNEGQKNTRSWLTQNNYFAGTNINVAGDGTLSGVYNSKVSWTENIADISGAIPNLFTTHSTDYIYGLSEAYNLLYARTPGEKANKEAIVIMLTDGTPNPANATFAANGNIYAFYNSDANIYALDNAIKGVQGQRDMLPNFWTQTTGAYQRHSVNPDFLTKDANNAIIGADCLQGKVVSVGYMLDSQAYKDRLTNIASSPSNYIDIPADAEGSTENYLTEKLLNSIVLPGATNAVLRDEISKYYSIPDGAILPEGVSVELSEDGKQTIVWDFGDVYKYDPENEPSIKIPLVLREEYRNVPKNTYYPTNADLPEVDVNTPEAGADGDQTGAKLFYTDPYGVSRYNTIGTPKLLVTPEKKEEEDTPPSKKIIKVLPKTGDGSNSEGLLIMIIGVSLAILGAGKKRNKKS